MSYFRFRPFQGLAKLRLVQAVALTEIFLCGVAHSQDGAFSVKDDIAMVRFSDPSAELPPSPENDAKLSPDGRLAAVVTTRGILVTDAVQSTLSIFDTESIRAFVNRHAISPPARRVVARIAAVPQLEQTVAYAPVIKDVRWSHSGRTLYFRGEAKNGAWVLYEAYIDGRRPKALTSFSYTVDRFDVANDTVVYSAAVHARDTGYAGRVINRDARDVTGAPLINILFPDEMPTYVPQTFKLYVLHPHERKPRSTQVPNYSITEISFLLYLLPFQVSPKGDKVILTTPVSEIPSGWERYDPPPRFEQRRLHPSDASLTSPDNVLRPRVYSVIDLRSGAVTTLIDGPNAENLGYYATRNRAAWSPDGQRILLTNVFLPPTTTSPAGTVATQQPCAVASVDLSSRAFHCLFFENKNSSVTGADVDDVSFIENRNAASVLFRRGTHGRSREEYDFRNDTWVLRGHTEVDALHRPGLTQPMAPCPCSRVRIYIKQGLNEPPALWAADTANSNTREIWNPNPTLRSLRFGLASVFQWQDSALREWTAGLVKPVGYIPGKRYPLVIQMYEFDEDKFLTDGTEPSAFAARELASVGFVVLQIRKKNVTLSDEDAQIHLEGYRSAIETLSHIGLIDPDKVGVIGFSWTCWYVMNALVKIPRLFAAATIAEGFDNSYMQYMLFGPGSPVTRKQLEQIRAGSPFGLGLETWVREAPGFHLDRIETPLRIEAMKPATILNEWEVYAGLSMQNKPVDLIYFPQGTHIHQRPLERLESQQGTIDWMRFWLQGYEDPAPQKQAQYMMWRKLRGEAGTLRPAE